MAEELVERLRKASTFCGPLSEVDHLFEQAADALERMAEALRPFADCCEFIDADESDEEWAKFRLLIKDYRRARTALEGKEQG